MTKKVTSTMPTDSNRSLIDLLLELEQLFGAQDPGTSLRELSAADLDVLRLFIPPGKKHALESPSGRSRRTPISLSRGLLEQEIQTTSIESLHDILEDKNPPEGTELLLDRIQDQLSDITLFRQMERSPDPNLRVWAYGQLVLRHSELLGLLPLQAEERLRAMMLLFATDNPTFAALKVDVSQAGHHETVGPEEQIRRLMMAIESRNAHQNTLDGDSRVRLKEVLDHRSHGASHEWVVKEVIRHTPSYRADGLRQQVREVADEWLSADAQSDVRVTARQLLDWVEVETGWGKSFNGESGLVIRASDVVFAPIEARRELDGLRAWVSLRRWRETPDEPPCADEEQIKHFIKAGRSIRTDQVEVWRNEVVDGALLKDVHREALSTVLRDPKMYEANIEGLPLDVLDLWLSEVRLGGQGELTGRAGFKAGHQSLKQLWSSLEHGLLSQAMQPNRRTALLEAYLDAVRKGGAQSLITRIFDWLRVQGIARTARMWESYVASTPLRGAGAEGTTTEEFRRLAAEDLGTAPFTAGLWTTLIARDYRPLAGAGEQDAAWLDASMERGELQLSAALNALAEMAPHLDASDRWFSEREIRRILHCYPEVAPYRDLDFMWSGSLNRTRSARTIGNVGETRVRLMVSVIAWAHALAGRGPNLERLINLLDQHFPDWEALNEAPFSKGDLKHAYVQSSVERSSSQMWAVLRPSLIDPDTESPERALDGQIAAILADKDLAPRVGGVMSQLIGRIDGDQYLSPMDKQAGRDMILRLASHKRVSVEQSALAPGSVGWHMPVGNADALEALRHSLQLLDHDIGNAFDGLSYQGRIFGLAAEQLEEKLQQHPDTSTRKIVDVVKRGANSLQQDIGKMADAVNLLSVATLPPESDKASVPAKQASELTSTLATRERPIVIQDHTEGAQAAIPPSVTALVMHTMLLNAIKHGAGQVLMNFSLGVSAHMKPVIEVTVTDMGDGAVGLADGIRTHEYTDSSSRFPSGPERRGLQVAEQLVRLFDATLEVRPIDGVDGKLFPVLTVPLLEGPDV